MADPQLDGRPLEPQPLDVRSRCFAGRLPKDLVEVEFGQLNPIGQKLQRQILIEVSVNVHERGNNPVEWRRLLSAHRDPIARIVKNPSGDVEYSLAA
jgi:hypothetical protein